MLNRKFKYISILLSVMMLCAVFALAASADNVLPPVVLNPSKVIGVELAGNPIKTQYLVGEKLDMSGAVLSLAYDNGEVGETVIKTEWCTGFDSSETGKKTVTVTYPETSFSVKIEVEVVAETSLTLVKPHKMVYFVGDKEDRAGLAVSVVYSNGKSELLESGYTVSGFSSNTIGEKKITVKYKDLSASYTIRVVEPALTEIKIEKKPNKLSYYSGEELDLSGIKVVAVYDNGKKADVTSEIKVESGITAEGSNEIKISYSERDFKKTAVFTVTVADVEIKNVEFLTYPDKKVYKENELFDPSGLSIKVTYNNGTTETVSEGIPHTGFDTETIGKKLVTFHYGGYKLDFEIDVIVSDDHKHKESEFERILDPTCTKPGEEIAVCLICGETVARKPVPALGHGAESDPVQTKAPTCTEHGEKTTYCVVCREAVTVSDIFPLGHSESEPETVRVPTCTEPGASRTYCKVCNATVEEKALDALGHGFGIWNIILEPTGEADGREERTCSVCSEVESKIIPKLVQTLVSDGFTATLTSPSAWFPRGCTFTALDITEMLDKEDIEALLPVDPSGKVYEIIAVYEFLFTGVSGDRYMPTGDIKYTAEHVIASAGYASYLIYDTDYGMYTPAMTESGISFTSTRSGKFILVGEVLPETQETENPVHTPEDTPASNGTLVAPSRGSSAIIVVLLIVSVILIVIIGALVYTYAVKRY